MKTFFKALISGFLLWATMFTLISMILSLYNQYELVKILVSIISGVIAILFIYYLKAQKIKEALVYSFTWLILGLILDYFVTMKFNEYIFYSPYLWLGYGLMFVSPLIYASLIKKKSIWKK